jgi:hypothetical protein
MAEKGFVVSALIGVFLSSAYADANARHLLGNMVPLPALYDPSSWNPDVMYTKLSSAFNYDDVVGHESNVGNQIRISYCNNYALNTGSIVYTPCNAHYLVAAHSNGVILPPNMCGGQMCPSAGGTLGNSIDAQTCTNLNDYTTGKPLTKDSTTLFDQYCLASQQCQPIGTITGTIPRTDPQYRLAPPVFTVSTNWCDSAAAGRTRAQYPNIPQFLGDSTVAAQQFCPADTTGGYSDTAVRACNFQLEQIMIFSYSFSIYFLAGSIAVGYSNESLPSWLSEDRKACHSHDEHVRYCSKKEQRRMVLENGYLGLCEQEMVRDV